MDFEYLPNGGFGQAGPKLLVTTWETFQMEPWSMDAAHGHRDGALGGWHTLVAEVEDGAVRYFVDGEGFAAHGGKYFPEAMMSINFNLWFTRDGLLPDPEARVYEEDIDWVYFEAGRARGPFAAEAAVADLRARGVAFLDGVPASGLASPCNL